MGPGQKRCRITEQGYGVMASKAQYISELRGVSGREAAELQRGPASCCTCMSFANHVHHMFTAVPLRLRGSS